MEKAMKATSLIQTYRTGVSQQADRKSNQGNSEL
jgi:hypothetical protein